mmetsp:Transcript_43369/g.70371  ORF Transcript_43369/g.70371 Transcript_43369/m.70371 type:complete len:476 (+) Transcript_43369:30-1457(+)
MNSFVSPTNLTLAVRINASKITSISPCCVSQSPFRRVFMGDRIPSVKMSSPTFEYSEAAVEERDSGAISGSSTVGVVNGKKESEKKPRYSVAPNDLVRSNVLTMQPYVPILPFEVLSQKLGRSVEDIVKLDANENPYGPSPKVAEALSKAPFLHIYPDPESRELRDALSEFTGIPAEYLLVGNGADELIDLMFRAFIDPGEPIVNTPPTFGMYKFDGDVTGAQVVNVWRREDMSVNVDAIEALFHDADHSAVLPKLIFVTSPNNPDGSVLNDEDLLRILALPAIVVLDEAYIEFEGGTGRPGHPLGEGRSRMKWVLEYPNLVVLRTFSKFAGLAGMRVGYGAFPLDIIEHLWKIKQPYNVGVASQIAAIESLRDAEHLFGNLKLLIEQRERLLAALRNFAFLHVYPSSSNFVLARVKSDVSKLSALEIKEKLSERGILIRYYNSPGLTDCVRFSIGTPKQMDSLLQALEQLSEGQ